MTQSLPSLAFFQEKIDVIGGFFEIDHFIDVLMIEIQAEILFASDRFQDKLFQLCSVPRLIHFQDEVFLFEDFACQQSSFLDVDPEKYLGETALAEELTCYYVSSIDQFRGANLLLLRMHMLH